PPINLEELPKTAEGLHVWDWWPVRDRSGQPTQIEGQYVAIALSAPDDVLPGKRHDIARYQLLTSPDGREWTAQGELFPEGDAIGSRQWAGSAMYDGDTGVLHVFYTAAGRADWEDDPDGTDEDSDDEEVDETAPSAPSGA